MGKYRSCRVARDRGSDRKDAGDAQSDSAGTKINLERRTSSGIFGVSSIYLPTSLDLRILTKLGVAGTEIISQYSPLSDANTMAMLRTIENLQ